MAYGLTQLQRGLQWFEYSMFFHNRFRTPLSIAFAEIATHNHFVLDRGGKVFKQTAPVIKLPEGATEEEHLALLGLLNSSTWCFWAQQVCHNKGGPGGGSSKDEKWHDFYALAGSKVTMTPIPAGVEKMVPLARILDSKASQAARIVPDITGSIPTAESLRRLCNEREVLLSQRVALQEELDWLCYRLFGLVDDDLVWTGPLDTLPGVQPGQRAFEIRLAREIDAGELETRWFERPERQFTLDIPDWPRTYRDLVQRRLDRLQTDPLLNLAESMSCKRRWEHEPWENLVQPALREWLLDRLESPTLWAGGPEPVSVHKLAEKLRKDADFLSVLDLYEKDAELEPSLEKLIANEGVPFLAAWRYTDSGLEKRADWEKTWELQRKEDAGKDPGPIAVPPKYASGDFRQASYWRLRGKLDVPKERFILYPGAERDTDKSLVLGWAGWDHLQRAMALAEYYQARKEIDAWPTERLVPLLAGLLELVPWVKQWHNEVHPEYEQRMGDYYATMAEDEARKLGLTLEDLRKWKPATTAKKPRKKKT